MRTNALVIMAKAPHPGNVKTRLKGSLTDDERVALYERLVHGTVERLRALEDMDTFITYTPREHSEYFSRFGQQVATELIERLRECIIRDVSFVLFVIGTTRLWPHQHKALLHFSCNTLTQKLWKLG